MNPLFEWTPGDEFRGSNASVIAHPQVDVQQPLGTASVRRRFDEQNSLGTKNCSDMIRSQADQFIDPLAIPWNRGRRVATARTCSAERKRLLRRGIRRVFMLWMNGDQLRAVWSGLTVCRSDSPSCTSPFGTGATCSFSTKPRPQLATNILDHGSSGLDCLMLAVSWATEVVQQGLETSRRFGIKQEQQMVGSLWVSLEIFFFGALTHLIRSDSQPIVSPIISDCSL